MNLHEIAKGKRVLITDGFRKKGKNARIFFEKYYQKDSCISNLEYYIKGMGFDNPPFPVPNI